VWTYLLAVAVLYPSADVALNALINQGVASSSRTRKIPDISTPAPEDGVVMRAYVQSLGCYAKSRKQLKLSQQSARTRFKKLGLPALSDVAKPGRRRALSALLLEGRSLADSAQAGRMTEDELISLLKESCPNLVLALREITNNEATSQRKGQRTRGMTPNEAEAVGAREAPVSIPLRVRAVPSVAGDSANRSPRRHRVPQ